MFPMLVGQYKKGAEERKGRACVCYLSPLRAPCTRCSARARSAAPASPSPVDDASGSRGPKPSSRGRDSAGPLSWAAEGAAEGAAELAAEAAVERNQAPILDMPVGMGGSAICGMEGSGGMLREGKGSAGRLSGPAEASGASAADKGSEGVSIPAVELPPRPEMLLLMRAPLLLAALPMVEPAFFRD